jgi:branched-chain amino acid transport system permease protein
MAWPRSGLSLLPALGVLVADMSPRTPRLTTCIVFAVVLALAIPYAGFRNSFLFELGIQIGIYAALALGLNIVVGMAGLLDLGYAGFFAIGAYTWAIFGSEQANAFVAGHHFPLPGWPFFYVFAALAVILAAGTGALVSLPALRLRGDYLAVVTLGLGQVVRLVANNLDHHVNITNGPQGITPVVRPPVGWLSAAANGLGLRLEPAVCYSLFFYLLVLLIVGASS